MITEALVLANPYITVPGTNNKLTHMSECHLDFDAYWKLGEYLVKVIENSSEEVMNIHLFTFF